MNFKWLTPKIYFICFIVLLLFSCEKENEDPNLPSIKTLDAEVFIEGGVALTGELTSLGTEQITEYGIELVEVSTPVLYKSLNTPKEGLFTVQISQNLANGREYTYAAYVITQSGAIYRGEKKTFLSKGSATPLLENITPSIAHIGDTVLLTGKKFGKDLNNAYLKFGKVSATILEIQENQIQFVVPRPNGEDRSISFEKYDKSVTNNDLLNLYTPVITELTPSTAFFGETIKISGEHFSEDMSMVEVKIENEPAMVISSTLQQIEVVVPSNLRYTNSNLLSVYAQNKWVTSQTFDLAEPQFLETPNEVYVSGYFEIKVGRTSTDKNLFYIGDYDSYPEILDDQNLRFNLASLVTFRTRDYHIRWNIDGTEFLSPNKLKIVNPFLRTGEGYSEIPFAANMAFTRNGKGYALGNAIDNSDSWSFIYQYNETTNTWPEKVRVENDEGLSALTVYSGSYLYSPYDDKVYGLRIGIYGLDLVRIDIDSGNLIRLSQDLPFDTLGTGFAHGNKVYFTAGPGLNEIWSFNIDTELWVNVTTLPFLSYRGGKYNAIVVDDYVYVANGQDGASYTDFWRMNLLNSQWERLADHPFPRKKATVYSFNNELHYVSDQVWKYDLSTNIWEIMEKDGITTDVRIGKFSAFIHDGIPYILEDSSTSFQKRLYIYKGDLVK